MTSLLDLDRQYENYEASLVNEYRGVCTPEEVREAFHSARVHLAAQATVEDFLPILSERMTRQLLTAMCQAEGRISKPLPEVLFASESNAARSHMAAALMVKHSDGRVNVRCAGSHPKGGLNPLAREVLAERGIRISHPYPLPFSASLADAADYLVLLGTTDFHEYPGLRWMTWDTEGLKCTDIDAARAVCDLIEDHVLELLAEIDASSRWQQSA